MDQFLRGLPKAELHLHIEGTLEPELMFELAERNGVALPHESTEALRSAYTFTRLQDFLDIYYQGAAVLRTTEDFYELTLAYLQRAVGDGVRRAEMFFDPQTHTERGVKIGAIIDGITRARRDAEHDLGISSGLIMCFLRHLPESAAMETLEAALPHASELLGVGIDSSELGNPPEKFATVFARARDEGLRCVAHAGEEGPPAYILGALDDLGAERIDHGVRCLEDPAVVARLRDSAVPLTVCPLSNVKLRVVKTIEDHPLHRMLDAGLNVSINSDDPAYFGGYVGDNYIAVRDGLGVDRAGMVDIARGSIRASFLPVGDKERLVVELEQYVAAH